MRFFTIGYEKLGIGDFIKILREMGIEILADIRAVPYSRNKDFSKKNLENKLSECGIDYLLIKELGSPKELREKVKTAGDYDCFFSEYDRLLNDKMTYLNALLDIARTKKICLFCYEADVNRCHRRSVAYRLRELDRNLEIVDL